MISSLCFVITMSVFLNFQYDCLDKNSSTRRPTAGLHFPCFFHSASPLNYLPPQLYHLPLNLLLLFFGLQSLLFLLFLHQILSLQEDRFFQGLFHSLALQFFLTSHAIFFHLTEDTMRVRCSLSSRKGYGKA